MILGSFMSKLTEYLSWLYQERLWTDRELLIIALVLLVLLLMILRRRRKKNIRTLRPEQLADRASVIGAKLGHGGGRHGLAGSRAGQLTFVPARHEKQQKLSKAEGRIEESYKQTERPQWEIVKPRQSNQEPEKKLAELIAANETLRRDVEKGKNTVEGLERKIAELTAANEQLRIEADEGIQTKAPLEQKVGELTTANEQLQREAAQHKETQDRFEQKLAELAAANERLQVEVAHLRRAGRKTRAHRYEDEHRVVDEVKQKLCRKCGQWKPEAEFHKNASRKDGLARWCKVCKTNAAKKSRERRADASD
jgi:chromosome segregation ATPase